MIDAFRKTINKRKSKRLKSILDLEESANYIRAMLDYQPKINNSKSDPVHFLDEDNTGYVILNKELTSKFRDSHGKPTQKFF